MSVILIAFGVLAFVHWIYEDVVAPSLRDWLRYQFFELRDELRMLISRGDAGISEDLGHFLQGSLNNTLKHMHILDLSFVLKARKIAKGTVNSTIAAKEALLTQCENEQIQSMRKRQLDLIGYALMINSGGWIIYLVPVLVLPFVFEQVKQETKQMLYMPEQEMLDLGFRFIRSYHAAVTYIMKWGKGRPGEWVRERLRDRGRDASSPNPHSLPHHSPQL